MFESFVWSVAAIVGRYPTPLSASRRAAFLVATSTHQTPAWVPCADWLAHAALSHVARVPPQSRPLLCVSSSKTTASLVGTYDGHTEYPLGGVKSTRKLEKLPERASLPV